MVDQNGAITFTNAQVDRLFGYSREEILGLQVKGPQLLEALLAA